MTVSDAWAQVWNDRDEDRADWNGCEACFETPAAYESWVAGVADFVANELGLGPDDDVLDLGCGTGRAAQILAPRVHSLIGLDFSRPALDVARRKRSAPNTTYLWADLNEPLAPEIIEGRSKAYAIGVVFYLSSVTHVLDIVDSLVEGGTDVMLVDLPDEELVDARPRDYDRTQYPHLSFSRSAISERFPQARFVQGRFPEYVNDAVRFTAIIPAT